MMKRKQIFLHEAAVITLILFLLGLTACCDEATLAPEGTDTPTPEGYVRLSATVGLEGLTAVQTRAVDPDVNGVESIRLYCFDENGLFITTVSTTFMPGDETDEGYILTGTFKADVPDYTRTVHIVANQSTDAFRDTDYLGKSERTVMTSLIASSSTMVYWGRVKAGMAIAGTEAPADETLAQAFDRIMTRDEPDNCIHLVRNQARVQFTTIENDETGKAYFNIEGFYVCNTNAFGTIAPYNESTGEFDWVTCGSDTLRNYVTLPPDPARVTVPDDIYSYESFPQQYVFETENPLTDPVSVIVKGTNSNESASKYYRILVQDAEYNTLLIRRNHSYDISIIGHLTPGYATLNEALNGTPVNNVLLTVSDEIKSLTGPNYTLSVDQTSYVLTPDSELWGKDNKFSFTYTFTAAANKADEDEIIGTENVTVTWMGEQNVAADAFKNDMTRYEDKDELTGTVTLDLLPLGDDAYHEGTIMIHAKRLIRRVKVITVKKQTFVPTWVSSYVWPGNSGEAFTLMFTIPEDTPAELFPFDVMVTAPEMDVRSETGLRLDVVTKVSDPDRYGKDIYYYKDTHDANGNEITPAEGVKPIGYKFIVPVSAPGRQRIYFRTTLPHQTADYVTIENPYFETMSLPFTFSGEDVNRSIVFTGMNNYKGSDADHEDYEGINYIVVPRKVNARVDFGFKVVNHSATPEEDVHLDEKDEFALFTTYLDRDVSDMAASDQHFTFLSSAHTSSTSGRFWGFWPKGTVDDHTEHTIYMKTNRPNTQGVVILRSNSRNAPSIKGSGNCEGNNYRSASFELMNYAAFRFNAQVIPQEIDADDAISWAGNTQPWTYEPGQEVDIAFDVTSFLSESQYGLDPAEVDPFGTSFKVYIDAPMIEIDEKRQKERGIPEDKFYYDESIKRFVYVVDKDRNTEVTAASLSWSAPTHYWSTISSTEWPADFRSSNPAERKVLPFITNSISSMGTITISAQSDIVDFDEETWTVVDKPITGRITYGDAETPIPAGAFVSFERTRDNTRIGSLTIGEGGAFRLSLRTEYSYAWGGTEYIAFYYTAPDGSNYALPSGTRMTLQDLFEDYYQKDIPVKLVKVNP